MKPFAGLFFRALGYLVSILPLGLREALGKGVGFLWFDVFRIRRQIAIENVATAFPELAHVEQTRIARSSLQHMGRTIVEYSLFPYMRKKHVAECFDFKGLEHIEKALAEGKGALLLGLHLGNGDYSIAALSKRGLPVNLISKEFKAKWLNDLWFGMRRKHGTQFIAPEKSSFQILRALKRNELVIFVLDQFMGPPVGVRTQFFGKETGTAAGLALMAARTGAPVIPTYTYRIEDGRHQIEFEEALPFLDQGPTEKNVAIMTQIYTDKIEAIVRRHPEQWMWIHRRWKEFRD